MYSDQPLQNYLNDLASSTPMPGGGSASALSGAMGAALASMVGRLTLGKTAYAQVQQEIETLVLQSDQLRLSFLLLLQEDIAAYQNLSASYKLPHTTDEQRTTRTKAIQTQLLEATHVPLHMVEAAAELTNLCKRVAQIGNPRLLSDLGVGATLAASAGNAAAWIVNANLHLIKDTEIVQLLSARLSKALNIIAENSTHIPTIVRERA